MCALRAQLFIFALTCLSLSLQAFTPKIVLLTSLDPETNRPPLRSKRWNINEKLEKRFYRYLSRYDIELEPQVVHLADQVDLYKTLTAKDVKAVIWVSHAGYKSRQGLLKASSIIDHNGRDLKGVFQAINSSVKFLGLVGCQGQDFIEQWRSSGWGTDQQLNPFSRSKKTDARKGLKLAMKSLAKDFGSKRKSYLEQDLATKIQAKEVQSINIQIKRRNLETIPMSAIQVYQKKRLITVLPVSSDDQTATIKIVLDKKSKKSDLKIVVDSGENSLSQTSNLGLIEFAKPYHNHWKIFSTPDGEPFGVGTNIYTSKKDLRTPTPKIKE